MRQPTSAEIEASPYSGYFAYCRRCWEEDGVLGNDGDLPFGPDTYFACHKHQVKWCVGSGVTSGWRRLTAEENHRNWDKCKHYQLQDDWWPEGFWERFGSLDALKMTR
jgi:hypothetical protein